jgi:adenylylsulfate kinase
MIFWIIGLSGSGKTTIGRELFRKLKARAPNTVLIDGDDIRSIFSHNLNDISYSVEGRRINAERIIGLCEMLDRQGMNVVCCTLSIFPDLQDKNRKLFSKYFEVYLNTSMDTLKGRDSRGLYNAAFNGEIKNVVGVDIPFPIPENSDLKIDTSSDNELSIELIASEILANADLIK